jgi:hypothetical protein
VTIGGIAALVLLALGVIGTTAVLVVGVVVLVRATAASRRTGSVPRSLARTALLLGAVEIIALGAGAGGLALSSVLLRPR